MENNNNGDSFIIEDLNLDVITETTSSQLSNRLNIINDINETKCIDQNIAKLPYKGFFDQNSNTSKSNQKGGNLDRDSNVEIPPNYQNSEIVMAQVAEFMSNVTQWTTTLKCEEHDQNLLNICINNSCLRKFWCGICCVKYKKEFSANLDDIITIEDFIVENF